MFLLQLLHQQPADVVSALQSGVQDLRNPPETLTGWLAGPTPTVPMFANLAADALRGPLGPVSPIPAMVQADDESSRRSDG